MCSLGEPVQLREDILPTGQDIFNHFLNLNIIKCRSGEWKHNTLLSVKVESVLKDVAAVWDRTGISHSLAGKNGERKITSILTKAKKLNKVALDRRDGNYGKELKVLFDVAVCHHPEDETCTCNHQDKV